MRVTYRSYAKINLYLDVLNRRRDGYHNIETIFQSVSLADDIEFERRERGVALECDRPDLPCDHSNLICRAASLLQEHTGCDEGVHIRLRKRIPVAAGLAGGSGNAAATLLALNRLWDLNLTPPRLHALALELGSDVPYCLVGGAAAATRRGEELESLPPLSTAWLVLVHPPIAIGTGSVYASPYLERNMERPFAGRTRSFRQALRALRAGNLAAAVFNRMESAVFAKHLELAELVARLVRAGCHVAAMSGSGPTLFGLCGSRDQAESVAAQIDDVKTTVVHTTREAVAALAPGSEARHGTS